MKILLKFVVSGFTAATLCSCAGLTTSTKSLDLRNQSAALDVKQRVVISQTRHGHEPFSVICAEPSPDALTVIGASSGLSINTGTGKTANLTSALSESGAFIGLRTQSIQLLRDAMYRLCEGYASGAVDSAGFAAMQRRYQSTMMGLIAIEQLTGPVVASQALLIASAEGKAGASAGDTAVSAAQASVQTATDAVLSAQTEADKARAKADTSSKSVKEARRKLDAAKTAKPPVQEEIDTLSSSLATLLAEQKTDDLDLADKHRRLDAANDTKRLAGVELAQAKSSVAVSTSGGGHLGEVARATVASNVALADAVKDIVKEINISYTKDGCLALMLDMIKNPELLKNLVAITTSMPVPKDRDTQVNPVISLRSTISACRNILQYPSQVPEPNKTDGEEQTGADPSASF